jgi:hypothetical protein
MMRAASDVLRDSGLGLRAEKWTLCRECAGKGVDRVDDSASEDVLEPSAAGVTVQRERRAAGPSSEHSNPGLRPGEAA